MREAHRILEARKQLKRACDQADPEVQRRLIASAFRNLLAWLGETRPTDDGAAAVDYEEEASRAG